MLTKNQITEIKSLSQKRGRVEHNAFLCEGIKILEEVLLSNFKILNIYYTSEVETQISELKIGKGVCCEKVSSQEISRISQLKTPSSVVSVVSLPKLDTENSIIDDLTLVLDSVQDPGNLGTIVRIADWFGIKNIYCSCDSADVFAPKVVQATMGAITRVAVHYVDLVDFLSKQNVPIYGTFLEGEIIYSQTLNSKSILVMGNEGRGISEPVKQFITNKLFIPPYPSSSQSVESLNVAVATSICVSEFRRG